MLSTAVLLAASMTIGQAEATNSITATEAKNAIEFMAGEWEYVSTVDGEETKGTSYRVWSQDRTCLVMSIQGKRLNATGIMGWDAANNQLVETWYNSLGERIELRYVSISNSSWEGASVVETADGKNTGTIRLEKKGENAFTFTATAEDMNIVSQNRRIRKPEQASPAVKEELKDFEYFVGSWEAKHDDGGRTSWTFAWNEDGTRLENELKIWNAEGEMTLDNTGFFCWDVAALRVCNHCITRKGASVTFQWAKVDDETWMTWMRGNRAKSTVAVVDEDNWTMQWGDETRAMKRKSAY
jgi:hypothetical protein